MKGDSSCISVRAAAIVVGAAIVTTQSQCVTAKENGLARTPQMGWNSWNHFACDISEDLIKDTADALVDTGLSGLGYNYLNLDDCWQATDRDSNGNVQPDETRFPSGMKALGDYIHSKGLKFGIYSSAGFKTCQALPASLGLEEMDAAQYATWGVDYLKYDNCYTDHGVPQQRYPAMAQALDASGRDILYSLCEWGRENPAAWARDVANSWRVTLDIRDDWNSILTRADIDAPLWRYAGPGGWNDPDMLEVGNGGCSFQEYMSHFSLWAMLKAPLIVGNDIRYLTPDDEAMQILSNKEIIAINQDPLGRQARRVWSDTLYSHDRDHLIATKCNTNPITETSTTIKSDIYLDAPIDQQWLLRDDGRIESTATGRCLVEEVTRAEYHRSASSRSIDNAVQPDIDIGGQFAVGTMSCDAATVWSTGSGSGGLIVSTTTGRCLEVMALLYPDIAEGKRIQTGICRNVQPTDNSTAKYSVFDLREHQQWTAPKGKLLNLYQRQCMTVDRDAPPGHIEEVWTSPLEDGSLAVLVLNKANTQSVIDVTWEMIGLPADRAYHVRDLWKHEDHVVAESGSLKTHVESHGVVVLKLSPVKVQ